MDTANPLEGEQGARANNVCNAPNNNDIDDDVSSESGSSSDGGEVFEVAGDTSAHDLPDHGQDDALPESRSAAAHMYRRQPKPAS
jgi:hypothetical protein